ncbi:hypothetical protein BGZ49_001754 [Haplosporangium sp. Z 27]|nr:hypothetical protein BGZ49_001754 [Haplosporangium sp. Z 27]
MAEKQKQEVEAELVAQYKELAEQGVDLDAYRIETLQAIHDSLNTKKSKYYRSLRGAAVAVVPLGGAGHTVLTGRSHAQKCVEAYGLTGRHGNKAIAKEVMEDLLKSLGIHIVAEETIGSTIPGVSSVMAAISAPKVMDNVLEAVHETANQMHIDAIEKVRAMSLIETKEE